MAKNVKAPKKDPPPKRERKVKQIREGLRGIVRIAGKDVRGDVKLNHALLAVRGIGLSTNDAVAKIIAKELSISKDILIGELNEEQVEKLDGVLMNLHSHLPTYLLNRRADPYDGKNKHLITNDLIFSLRQDIEKEKKLYTWKGYRHAYGKKVRGQKTRNTGRRGMAVGVMRKAILEKNKAATGAKKEEKK